jgi:hypothetical protein
VFRPVADRDGDGAFPAPCGDDCNDIDDTVGPGAAEVCDAADEDCDGAIDEGAPATNALLVTTSPSIFLPADDGALLVHTGGSGRDFVAHRFGPVRALEPPRGVGSFDTGVLAGARGNDGVYAIVVHAGTAQHALFGWSASELTIVRPLATVPGLEVGATSAFDVIAFGDTVAIAYDAGTRNVRIGIEGPDVPIGAVVSPSDLSLATGGTHLAVLDPSEDTLVFVDARGTVVARHPVPPTPRSRSITSGDGRIYVATWDGTRSALTPVTRAMGAGASVPPFDGHAWIAYVAGVMVVAVASGSARCSRSIRRRESCARADSTSPPETTSPPCRRRRHRGERRPGRRRLPSGVRRSLLSRHANPPFTPMTWPVMYEARSLARNATTSATSSGRPTRCIGIIGSTMSIGRPSIISVSITPGATQFTVIFRFASSFESAFVAPMMPAFAAE